MKFQDLLICPYCKEKLFNYKCSNKLCLKFKKKQITINKKPVLIDFSNFIHNKNDFLSYQRKIKEDRSKPFLWKLLKSLIDGKPIITKKNIIEINNKLKEIKNPSILIVGGGTIGHGLKEFYNKYNNNIVSFDIYLSKNIDFIADAHNIPFIDKTFDLVIIQAVLEHVLYPKSVVNEIYRVLKNNGYVYAETPFMQQVHEGAYDFTRYTDSGHRFLFSNFTHLNSGFITGAGTSLLWSIDYFFSGIFRSKSIGKLFKILFFWLRFFDFFIPNKYNIDGASGVFFFGVKKNIKFSDSSIIKYYKGNQI